MTDESAILIHPLKVKPGKQDPLIALLKQKADTVIRTLHRWTKAGAVELDRGLDGVVRNMLSANTQIRLRH
jgi:hypothetical protein